MAAILIERRQNFVERDIAECPWTSADLLVGGVADDPVDPGSEGRVAPERIDLPHHAPKRILDSFLRVLLVARNPCRQPISSIAIRGDKSLDRRGLPLAEGCQKVLVRIESRCHIDLLVFVRVRAFVRLKAARRGRL